MMRFWFAVFCVSLACSQVQGVVSTVVLENFEGGGSATFGKATTLNSASGGDTFSAATVAAEGGSNRLRFVDSEGFRNGIFIQIPNAIPAAGHYIISADIKVDNATAAISTMGMGIKLGAATTNPTAPVDDINAAYIPNLPDFPNTAASLGYQTIAASIKATTGPFPQTVTLYVGSDISVGPFFTGDGDFAGPHRGSGQGWQTVTNTASVHIDNITRVGPGNYGEERCLYLSIGDGITNLPALETKIRQAKAEGFNAICILARYRANLFYVKNRNFNTYTNPEPAAGSVTVSNDPLQRAIDVAHDEDMKVFAAFSCFLVTDGSNIYPSHMPAGSQTHVYNGGSPRAQTGDTGNDSPEGIWADPGRNDVRAHTINVLRDLVQNYDIDGVLFDRVRYSGNSPSNLATGYNPVALSNMGIAGIPVPTDAAFITARQEAITTFLHDAYEAVTDMKPWVIVGSTPIAYSNSLTDTYRDVFQSFPSWTKRKTENRVMDFGVQDSIHPQFYRQHDSGGANAAPQANRDLIRKAMYGEIGIIPTDFGLMPGANANLNPLYFAPLPFASEADADGTANALAINICDTRNFPTYASNGFGIFNARPVLTAADAFGTRLIDRIASKTTACGIDILGTAAPHPDFLMKEGWDSTPPNNISSGFGTISGNTATLNWTAPAAAVDGDVPTRYLVYRSTSNAVPILYSNQRGITTVISGTSFTDTGVSGNVHYRVVPVDEYNNKAAGFVISPTPAPSVVIESRTNTGAVTVGTYAETGTFSNTASKSVIPGVLVGAGARFNSTIGTSALFTPNLPVAGTYNVFVTLAVANGGPSAGPSNDATAGIEIINRNAPVTGTVLLAPGPTISNTWKQIATNVSFGSGTGGSLRLTNQGGANRYCMDAVKFELVSPDTTSVLDWALFSE